jgi:hypothetical protein
MTGSIKLWCSAERAGQVGLDRTGLGLQGWDRWSVQGGMDSDHVLFQVEVHPEITADFGI